MDPFSRIVLFADVNSSDPSSLTTRWSQSAGPVSVNLTDPSVTATPPDSPNLVLKPGALQPGSDFELTLTATDSRGTATATVALRTASVPGGVNGGAHDGGRNSWVVRLWPCACFRIIC